MNRDPEDIQRHLLRLLQDLFPAASPTDIEAASQALGSEAVGQAPLNPSDLQSPQNVTSQSASISGSDRSFQKEPVLDFGDVPAVQDRFHALLKHRLQSEIQQHPPLFPWESEIQDYEANITPPVAEVGLSGDGVSSRRLNTPALVWLRQLSAIKLPVQVPERVLVQLLEQCQELAQSSLREGAKLVRAVEELFPEQSQSLNYLAGLVVTSPARSGSMTAEPPATANFPKSYEAAVPAQQMVLSLLAAREILNSLTLKLTPQQPSVSREWETDAGTVVLRASYDQQGSAPSLRVQATLPCGGRLVLKQNELQSVSRRPQAGLLGVELAEVQLGQCYALDVGLQEQPVSLTFTIHIAQD